MSRDLHPEAFETGDQWVNGLARRLRVAATFGSKGEIHIQTSMTPTMAREAAQRLDQMSDAVAVSRWHRVFFRIGVGAVAWLALSVGLDLANLLLTLLWSAR